MFLGGSIRLTQGASQDKVISIIISNYFFIWMSIQVMLNHGDVLIELFAWITITLTKEKWKPYTNWEVSKAVISFMFDLVIFYKSLVMTVAYETWTRMKEDFWKLSVFRRRILRKIFCPIQGLWEVVSGTPLRWWPPACEIKMPTLLKNDLKCLHLYGCFLSFLLDI